MEKPKDQRKEKERQKIEVTKSQETTPSNKTSEDRSSPSATIKKSFKLSSTVVNLTPNPIHGDVAPNMPPKSLTDDRYACCNLSCSLYDTTSSLFVWSDSFVHAFTPSYTFIFSGTIPTPIYNTVLHRLSQSLPILRGSLDERASDAWSKYEIGVVR